MNQSPCPYIVIGYYKPRIYAGSVIGPDILRAISKYKLQPHNDPVHGPQQSSIWCNVPLHAEVRRFAQKEGQGASWHQDGDLADGSVMDHAAVLWADDVPTEFKTPDGVIWQPNDWEIVLARNLGCHHRTPPNTPKPPKRRWFFRQRVAVPTHIQLP